MKIFITINAKSNNKISLYSLFLHCSGFRALGFNVISSFFLTIIVHLTMSYATLPVSSFLMNISIKMLSYVSVLYLL